METLEKIQERKRFGWSKVCTNYLSNVWAGQGCATQTSQKICINACKKAALTHIISSVTNDFVQTLSLWLLGHTDRTRSKFPWTATDVLYPQESPQNLAWPWLYGEVKKMPANTSQKKKKIFCSKTAQILNGQMLVPQSELLRISTHFNCRVLYQLWEILQTSRLFGEYNQSRQGDTSSCCFSI